MLTCKQTDELMSQALDRNLGLAERFKLRVHLVMCNGCRNAQRHLGFLRAACSAWLKRNE